MIDKKTGLSVHIGTYGGNAVMAIGTNHHLLFQNVARSMMSQRLEILIQSTDKKDKF